MRIGVVAENLMERLALRANVVPEPMLETQMAFSLARSIMIAVKVDLFETMKDAPKSAADIAKTCGTHPGATEKLLGVLVSSKYLTYRDASFALTRKSRQWLLKDSPKSIREKLIFQFHEWEWVAKYDEYLHAGEPYHVHASDDDADFWNSYQLGMRDLGGIAAEEVAKAFPMPAGATALLDIGGSHGYYSVLLCRKYPGLKATILDLPAAVQHAAPILERENMGDRVVHWPGNALEDDLGEAEWDAVFMSQLVHHFTDEQNRELIVRIARALKPGGVCVILDSIRPREPGQGGQTAALLDLYFAMTSESGTWPLETIHDWYRAAGLRIGKTHNTHGLPNGALVAGEKA